MEHGAFGSNSAMIFNRSTACKILKKMYRLLTQQHLLLEADFSTFPVHSCIKKNLTKTNL
jgi:hypothetical protein